MLIFDIVTAKSRYPAGNFVLRFCIICCCYTFYSVKIYIYIYPQYFGIDPVLTMCMVKFSHISWRHGVQRPKRSMAV